MTAIALEQASKAYVLYDHPVDRLLEIVTGKARGRHYVALAPLTLSIAKGEVVGVIGMNGAGKSTLLKLLAHTLQPTTGSVRVSGRVSALLELGAGFHPDLSGRDNAYLGAAIAGLSRDQIDHLYPEIVQFSGLEQFMAQPVKTYSSGMFVRLAFAVATCVPPEILIVDEALSVGDGAFARKSFDRIMAFKDAGKTILFCSHSLYQVEALCERVLWLHNGKLMMDGSPQQVVTAYNELLSMRGDAAAMDGSVPPNGAVSQEVAHGSGKLVSINVSADGVTGRRLEVASGVSEIKIRIRYALDPSLPVPSVAVAITTPDGEIIGSAGTANDRVTLRREADGGEICVVFPKFPLLKGRYLVNAYLMCERAIHVYDSAIGVAEIDVHQQGLEQGLVVLPHQWGN